MIHKIAILLLVLGTGVLGSTAALADSVTVKNRSGKNIVVETFNGNDSVCLAHYDTWPIKPGEDKTLNCDFGGQNRCKILVSDTVDNTVKMCSSGVATSSCGSSNVVLVQSATPLTVHATNCTFNYPTNEGYIYGTNSNANSKCLQAQTDNFANGVDVHVWNACSNGSPQKNRLWKYDYSTGYIRNIADPSFCLHKQTNGFSAGDNIHMWKCDEGSEENKAWEYNFNGQHLIRSRANNNFCIFRSGGNVGDAIHLWSCDPNNNIDQNGRWNITWGDGG